MTSLAAAFKSDPKPTDKEESFLVIMRPLDLQKEAERKWGFSPFEKVRCDLHNHTMTLTAISES